MSSEFRGKKIAVLAGGPSSEREISFLSGQCVYEALAAKGFSAVPIDPIGDFIPALKKEDISWAFLALHGAFGEDGTIQKILEKERIAYTGSSAEASLRAFDKSVAQGVLRGAGVRIPDFVTIDKEHHRFEAPMQAPFVVKPARSGSSIGLTIVRKETMYHTALERAFEHSDVALVEEYIQGRELTVGVLGDEPLPVVEVIAAREFYDYEAKYKDNGTRYEFPAKLDAEKTREVQNLALSTYRALGARVMGRVDVMLDARGVPYVLELNTIPGLTKKSLLPKAARARGIEFGDLCVRIMELSFAKVGAF